MSIRPRPVRRECERATNGEENVMYIPYQFLIAIENDRLRTLERHQFRQAVCRERAARLAREADAEARRSRHGLGRRVGRAFGRRASAGAVA
jgi:hypothetical protein